MRLSWLRAGFLLLSGLVVAGLVTSCAGRSVAGTPGPGTTAPGPGSTAPGPGGTTTESPTSTDGPGQPTPGCPATGTTPDGPIGTPSGKPMITITQGTNSWVASDLTQPYAIAVYPDGTAIRTEDLGITSEPLPELTIGRLDECQLQAAVAEILRLSETDLGEASVTDQGTTRITLQSDEADAVLDVYALGVGDELVQDDQRAAREQLTALIDSLTSGMAQTATWTPDRLRVSSYGTPADLTGGSTWPLAGTIASRLDQGGRRPCGVFDGDDAAAIRTELGTGRAASSWTDGKETVVLAIGVLVPGQDCSPT